MKESVVHSIDCKTVYSQQKSILKISDIVKYAAKNSLSALGIADEANLSGAFVFYNQCRQNGIKPLIGVQLELCDSISIREKTSEPIVLYAKSLAGFKNLCELVSFAQSDGFYYKPRIDFDTLEKFKDDLVCLSGGIDGPIASAIIDNKKEFAEIQVEKLKAIFGDDFYLEINPYKTNRYEDFVKFCESYKDISVVTNCARYLTIGEYEDYDLLFAIKNKKKFFDAKRKKANPDEYIKSYDRVLESLGSSDFVKLAISRTQEIIDKCNLEFDSKLWFPNPVLPNGTTNEKYFKSLVNKGWKKLKKDLIFATEKEYKDRLYYEYDTILKFGFVDYFLVVQDIVSWCKSEGISVGPGRGSVGGSLLAFMLEITEVDPIKEGLIFERFLNPEGKRTSMPDIDLDISSINRSKVIEFIEKRYGSKNVAAVGNIMTLALKSAIKDVGKALNIPFDTINAYTKPINNKIHTKQELLSIKEYKRLYDGSSEFREILDKADKLIGSVRAMSTHASGIVVAPKDLSWFTPIQPVKDKKLGIKRPTCQLDKDSIESMGLLKIDVLGLTALDTISICYDFISKTGKVPSKSDMDFDDQNIYQLTEKGLTRGIFQLGSEGITELTKKIKPKCLRDIRDINALYRPAILESRLEEIYIRNKFKDTHDSVHPIMDSITKETYGIPLFQEQSMATSVKMAGFTYAESDTLRKALAKKKGDNIPVLKQKFIDGCLKNNISKDDAEKVFSIFENASYQFNASHSLAYGIITCKTLWLKTYFCTQYMCACFTSEMGDSDEIEKIYSECIKLKINVNQPDINLSNYGFSIHDNNIVWGFGAIKEIGEGFSLDIERVRSIGGNFLSVSDFLNRLNKDGLLSSNSSKILVLANVGCFDSLEPNRKKVCSEIERYASASKSLGLKIKNRNQSKGLFGISDIFSNNTIEIVDDSTFTKRTNEQKYTGVVFT